MIAILTTHPIQYQVPLWQALAKDRNISFEVWYLTRHGIEISHDREFGEFFAWDIDMLSGYPHRFLEMAPGASPSSFWRCRLQTSFIELLRDAGVTTVWIQGWQVLAYWQAAHAAMKLGIEVWLRAESNDLAPTALWKRTIKHVMLGQLFRRVNRFLYIGSANRRLYKKFGIPDSRLYPAPYAVDNERFGRQAIEMRNAKCEIRKQWGIPDDAFCVLFCGKFIRKKRPLDLIEATRLLLSSHPEKKVHLLFVGSGELGAEMRATCGIAFDAEENQSAIRVPGSAFPNASFAGFLNQTEISKAYVAADGLVLPSDYGETWGLVVNEAMASGLPCIVSDNCGCAEDLVPRSPNSQVYPCGDVAALANALENMAMEPVDGGRELPVPGLNCIATTVDLVSQLDRLVGQVTH